MTAESLFASSSLTQALSDAIQAHGARSAISCGNETWSYARLGTEIASVAAALRDSRETVLYSPCNTPLAVAIVFGAIAAGCVPLITDPTWTDTERQEAARRCGVRSVITEQNGVAEWLTRSRRVGNLVLHDVSFPPPPPDPVMTRPDTAFCRFTSGTTGFSRCLEFSHAAALGAAQSWWQAVRYTPEDVVLCLATLNNGLAFNTSLLAVLLSGAHLVFHSGPILASALAATSRRFPPTIVVAFPFVYDALVAARSRLRPMDASRLRLAVSSAAPLKPESAAAFRASYGIAISNYYGLVEAGPCTFGDGSVPGSLGVPLDGVAFKILTEDEQEGDAAAAAVGRLCVKSGGMASQFLDTRGPSFADSLDDEGYYLTNDLASLGKNGHLFLHGRLGRIMNIEGRKVDPNEVEQIIRTVEGVTDVIAREETANGRALIAAYVESGALAEGALIDLFVHHLAPYKRPQRLAVLPRFPRSAAGKVLLNQLTNLGDA